MTTIAKIQRLYPSVRFGVLEEYFDFKGGRDGDDLFDLEMYAEDLEQGPDRVEFETKLNEFLETWFDDDFERQRYDELYAVFAYLMQCTKLFIFIGEFDEASRKRKFDESILGVAERKKFEEINKSIYSSLADMEYDAEFKIRKEAGQYCNELKILKGLLSSASSEKIQQINLVCRGRNHVFKNKRILHEITSIMENGLGEVPDKAIVLGKRAKRLPSDLYRARLALALYEYVEKYIVPGRSKKEKQNTYCFIGEMLAYTGFAKNLRQYMNTSRPKHYGKDSAKPMDLDKRNFLRYSKYLRKNVSNWVEVGKTLPKA